jgi:hypothetical protein
MQAVSQSVRQSSSAQEGCEETKMKKKRESVSKMFILLHCMHQKPSTKGNKVFVKRRSKILRIRAEKKSK